MRPVITARGLGKCYAIRHESKAQFTTMREEIAAAVRQLGHSKGRVTSEMFWALRDVDFSVMEGERLGIIGPNGAGKSTLLKLLSRITEPSTGRMSIRGRLASLLEVGTGFHPELSGRENIYLNGAILGMTRREIDRRFDEIVSFAEVERFLDTPVKRYSSGMYMRLAFAVAAHLESDILIVDEVLAVGDAAFQRKCLSTMQSATENGRTVLFVSHNMQAVKRLCERVLVLDGGSVVTDDEAEKAVQSYLQRLGGDGGVSSIERQLAALPEDTAVRLRQVSITQDGYRTDEPETGKPLDIQVDFDVLERVRGLRIYYDLCDPDGTVLLRSFHDELADSPSVFDLGAYTAWGQIPAGLLGPASYRLVIRATLFNERSCTGNGVWVSIRPVETTVHNSAYPNDTFRAKLVVDSGWSVKSRG